MNFLQMKFAVILHLFLSESCLMLFPITCAECPSQCSELKFVDDHFMREWMGKKKQQTHNKAAHR